MLDSQKESKILKKLSMKKSFLAAFFIGTLMPLVIAKYNAVDHFISFDLLTHHLIIIIVSIFAVFGIIFLVFLRIYKCPKCCNNWTYKCIEDDILTSNINIMDFKLFTVRFWFDNEIHLEEYHCNHCHYEKTIKVTRRFIRAGN